MSVYFKLESYQYKGFLTSTGAIKGTAKKKLYQELGLETPITK